ncbi:MAG: hypothetical protein DRO01_05255 [Thermoproteota archaeon]|nr:MAG: hypothetical protein DRO01_05255 [Candidatus Korarchaeota archaeon]
MALLKDEGVRTAVAYCTHFARMRMRDEITDDQYKELVYRLAAAYKTDAVTLLCGVLIVITGFADRFADILKEKLEGKEV